MNHPLLLLLMTGAGLYCARLWWSDMKKARNLREPYPEPNRRRAESSESP